MYTLYFSPGSCSLVIHCLLEELRVPFELKRVDLDAGEHHGSGYRRINPKGKVPALATPEGVLTECVAIIGYLCDAYDDGKMLARHGTWQRSKTMERVATLATEVHPLFNRFFHEDDFSDSKDVRAAVKARGTEKLLAYFREQDAQLTHPYWSGDSMTVADLYFMVIARWGRWLDPPANEMKNIRPFYERMISRPAVARAFAAEGIKPFGTS
ncbi:MAG: glutathione S-transferase family protein [Usitatibacter sp.]